MALRVWIVTESEPPPGWDSALRAEGWASSVVRKAEDVRPAAAELAWALVDVRSPDSIEALARAGCRYLI
jgi:hypothetical protein